MALVDGPPVLLADAGAAGPAPLHILDEGQLELPAAHFASLHEFVELIVRAFDAGAVRPSPMDARAPAADPARLDGDLRRLLLVNLPAARRTDYSRRVEQTKFLLDESQLPRRWYNVAADMPNPPQPVLHPGTGEPVGPDDLAPLFPMALILQEVSEEPEIAIPEEILDIYSLWRPTPLYRARRLEQAVGTRSRIFYKYEGVSPPGSHKPNTAVAQAYYNKQEGRTRLSTETGAGQWGSALAFACKLIGLECKVYMVRDLVRAEAVPALDDPDLGRGDRRQPVRGHASRAARSSRSTPTRPAASGSRSRRRSRTRPRRDDTAYSLGSVLNHVLLHQTVIGQEAIAQMELAGAFPDVVIGCVGGGSNFAGLAFPFIREKIAGREIDVLACEPAACPTLTRGLFAYDFGDTSKLTPLVPMHTLGHDFVPAPIHAGGLRYHGVAPLISQLVQRRADPRGGLPPERRLRLGRPVRAHRGDHPGARVGARDPRRARGRAGRPTRRARSGRSSSTSPATATSTWPRTTTTSPASSRTSRSTRTRSSARCARSRGCRPRPRADRRRPRDDRARVPDCAEPGSKRAGAFGRRSRRPRSGRDRVSRRWSRQITGVTQTPPSSSRSIAACLFAFRRSVFWYRLFFVSIM